MRLFKKLSALICVSLILSPLASLSYRSTVNADSFANDNIDLCVETDNEYGDLSVDTFDIPREGVYPEEAAVEYKLLTPEVIALIEKTMKSCEAKVDVSSFQIPYDHDKLCEDMAIFHWDHPLYFFVARWTLSYNSRTNCLAELGFVYRYEKAKILTMLTEIEPVTKEALGVLDDSMSDYQKALALHDWMAYQTAYATERLDSDTLLDEDFNLYGVLVKKEAVCQGYAEAYKYLLDKCGILCHVVSNDDMDHAWNVVKIGSSYYNVDVTWDDPSYDIIGFVRHIYFLVDNETMWDRGDDHFPPDDFDGSKLTSKTYANAKWVDVTSAISFYKNEWYYSSWDSSKRCAQIRRSSDLLTSEGTVFYSLGTSEGKWYTNNHGYYPISCCYPMVFAHYLIFNTNQSICYFDLSNVSSTPSVMYESSALNGVNVSQDYCVYGFKVSKDYVYYFVNNEFDVSKIYSLPNKLKAEATATPVPSEKPTEAPTKNPTKNPTTNPTVSPTKTPTEKPTVSPTKNPTKAPTTAPSGTPSKHPTVTPKPGDPTPTLTTKPGDPTPTTKPGEPTPTLTTKPGDPTPTTKPGDPTPTTKPGDPTPTMKPGDPTPTTKPDDPTPTPDPEKEPSIADFVERLYTVALNRDSEPEGKAYWVKEIEDGNRTGGDCAHFFLIEAEEFRNRGLNEEDFVETLYLTFFDRGSEPNGKAFWVGQLKSGAMTRNQVISGFIDSTEWCNVCATYGVKSGAPNAKAEIASKNAIKFATRLYTCCLGREPEKKGLDYWALALTNLEQTGCSAAKLFFTSDEFVNFRLKNDEYVRRLYTTFMGRDPESSEIAYWVGEINAGRQSKDSVMAFFGQSEEFTKICKQYGIERGTI